MESPVNYRKYEVQSPLFALRHPRLSEHVLAAFAGVTRKPLPPAPPSSGQASRGWRP